MDEWWRYEPADLLMFSPDTYYRLFELTNAALWPGQILTLGAGLVVFGLMVWGPIWRGRVIAVLLAAAWSAVAWVYFLERYAQINLAAPLFAYGFIAQAVLIAISGVALGRLTFDDPKPLVAKAGIALFIYALLVRPLTGPLLGRAWPGVELFGIAPDPTALATLGVVLASDRVPLELMILPLLWCAVTGAILWTMGSPEWWVMPFAALIVFGLVAYRKCKPRFSVL